MASPLRFRRVNPAASLKQLTNHFPRRRLGGFRRVNPAASLKPPSARRVAGGNLVGFRRVNPAASLKL